MSMAADLLRSMSRLLFILSLNLMLLLSHHNIFYYAVRMSWDN